MWKKDYCIWQQQLNENKSKVWNGNIRDLCDHMPNDGDELYTILTHFAGSEVSNISMRLT